MNQQDLENLPYPMFKTTWYEKRILRKALTEKNSKYLCHRIKYGVRPFFEARLVQKVHDYSGGHLALKLSNILGMSYVIDTPELRDIWIKKLLDYKGE